MNLEDLNIFDISLGKKVQVEYEVLKESRIYMAEDDEYPHPEFEKALEGFQPDFADSFERVENEAFHVGGITIGTDKGGFHIILKGKMATKHDESVSVISGKIPVPEDSNLVEKVAEIRKEAFEYLFEGKCAQGKLDLKERGSSPWS